MQEHSNRRVHRFGLLAVLAGALSVLYLAPEQPARARQRCSADESSAPLVLPSALEAVLQRAKEVCQIVAPTAGELSLMAEPIEARTAPGAPLRTWHVECDNPRGEYLAEVDWDADTGELERVACYASQPQRGQAPLSGAAAARAAGQWLFRLGIASERSTWRLACAHRPTKVCWFVRLRGEGKEASVMLESHSGHITGVRCWRAQER